MQRLESDTIRRPVQVPKSRQDRRNVLSICCLKRFLNYSVRETFCAIPTKKAANFQRHTGLRASIRLTALLMSA
jgi:hypothetical protein